MTVKRSWSKWSKHKVLSGDSAIAGALPETRWMTKAAVYDLLDRYGKIIAKPTQKWGGQGLMMVTALGDGRFQVKTEKTEKTAGSKSRAWSYLQKYRIGTRYIVQQYIPLARVSGRPFDLRVMVQRKKGGAWTVTGKLAKVAGRGHFITNMIRSHGKILDVETALSQADINGSLHGRIVEDIDRLALAVAGRLSRSYSRRHTIGLDLGVDRDGKVWFIEANFTPMISFFRKLKDRSMYRRILHYQRQA